MPSERLIAQNRIKGLDRDRSICDGFNRSNIPARRQN
jgi:hypothetical protein